MQQPTAWQAPSEMQADYTPFPLVFQPKCAQVQVIGLSQDDRHVAIALLRGPGVEISLKSTQCRSYLHWHARPPTPSPDSRRPWCLGTTKQGIDYVKKPPFFTSFLYPRGSTMLPHTKWAETGHYQVAHRQK